MKVMSRLFHDRMEAGLALAELLGAYAHRKDVLILALPEGGVPVAFEVARALDVPLSFLSFENWTPKKRGVGDGGTRQWQCACAQ